jgi:replicative DNA helicase
MNENDTQEYEQAFLGSLLIANSKDLPSLAVQSFYFYSKNNGLIFKTYQEQRKNGIKPDILTLCHDPSLADVDKSYISSLTNKIPSAANIQFYDTEIIKAWQTRTAKVATENFNIKIKNPEYYGGIEAVLREFDGIISGALCDKHDDVFITLDDYINSRVKKEYWREYTPRLFGNLPFQDGTFSAIGAAPGGGKTAALINLCRELLTMKPTDNPHPGEREKAQDIDAKRKILYISAEMSTEVLLDRLVHSLAWQEARQGDIDFLKTVEHTNKDYWKLFKKEYGTPPDHWTFSQQEQERAKLYKQVFETYIRPTWGTRLKIAYVRNKKNVLMTSII